MKIKNKGKVHPSPLHHHLQNSSSNTEDVVVSVMKLLPTTILAIASVLSLQDREVLAYMITCSLQTTTTTSTKTLETHGKRAAAAPSKRTSSTASFNSFHKPPLFGCDCFGCYTSYWLRWDSSPNRELIHQVIEAFEDHLLSGEQNKKNSRAKRREKTSRTARRIQQSGDIVIPTPTEAEIVSSPLEMVEKAEEINASSPVRSQEVREEEREEVNDEEVVAVTEAAEDVEKVEDVANLVPIRCGGSGGTGGSPAANNHKGLARKVLPDVLGILNSRLWNLWSPNV